MARTRLYITAAFVIDDLRLIGDRGGRQRAVRRGDAGPDPRRVLDPGRPVVHGPSGAAAINLDKMGAPGGDISLVARAVSNVGSITAGSGTVGLLAHGDVLLRDAALDDGKFVVRTGDVGDDRRHDHGRSGGTAPGCRRTACPRPMYRALFRD